MFLTRKTTWTRSEGEDAVSSIEQCPWNYFCKGGQNTEKWIPDPWWEISKDHLDQI